MHENCSQSVCSSVLIVYCLACVGDQSMHQLWRMHHGEIFQKHQPHIAIVMIGTNDLGAASCLGKGEAPILQAAAGTADRCNYIYLHSTMDSFYFLCVSLLRLETQLLGKHSSCCKGCAAVVHANDQSINLHVAFWRESTDNSCNVCKFWMGNSFNAVPEKSIDHSSPWHMQVQISEAKCSTVAYPSSITKHH